MRVRIAHLLVVPIAAAVSIAIACSGTYSDQCTSLGGVCVAGESQCGGSLPYSCTVGVCCQPVSGDGAVPDVGVSSSRDSSVTVHTDAGKSGQDATLPVDSSLGPDTSSPVDTGTPTMDVAVADQGSPTPEASVQDSASQDVVSKDVVSDDVSNRDAATHDGATHDAATHDGATEKDAARDAPVLSCVGYAPPDLIALCDACTATETCQANGCFGGYYCNILTLHCTKPSLVTCDGG